MLKLDYVVRRIGKVQEYSEKGKTVDFDTALSSFRASFVEIEKCNTLSSLRNCSTVIRLPTLSYLICTFSCLCIYLSHIKSPYFSLLRSWFTEATLPSSNRINAMLTGPYRLATSFALVERGGELPVPEVRACMCSSILLVYMPILLCSPPFAPLYK